MKTIEIIIAGESIFGYCPKCNQYIEAIKWHRNAAICKKCKTNYNTKYNRINKKHLLKMASQWYKHNKKRALSRQTIWRKNNKKYLAYYHKNNQKITTREYQLKKYKTDINYRIKINLRSRLRKALRKQNTKKTNHTLTLTGCTTDELKRYIESKFNMGMTWENYGKWHMDHITPCAAFNLKDPKEQEKCFHYTNLQPLWANENFLKGAKLVPLAGLAPAKPRV